MRIGNFNLHGLYFFIAVLLLILLPFLVVGKTYKVPQEGGKYDSIQSAVDTLNPGGVLLIEPGSYHESTTITEKLKISLAKVGEGIISIDAVTFSLIGNADVYSPGLKLKNPKGNEVTGNPIGLELKYPDRFEGSVTSSGNEITGTDSDFEEYPSLSRKNF